ncbi:MAG: hypothetical protein NVSMB2_19100 [Chloroflexota bacterium]
MVSSTRVWSELARSRGRNLTIGLLVLGCSLLTAGIVQGLADRPPQLRGDTAAHPTIQVYNRFGGSAPDGQTTGFAVAPDGSLAYVDRSRQRVIRLNPQGSLLAEWGPRFAAEEDDALDLSGIVAAGSNWFVLDRGRTRILRLDGEGRATRFIDLQPYGTYGPNGLAVDARGNVYMADTGSNRILVFTPDGALLRTIGTAGAELGQLKQPMALSFGPDGALYVTDFENNRLARWDAGLHATNTWPLTGHAWGVSVDNLNRVFVPDADHQVVRMFSARGDLLAEIGGPGTSSLSVTAPSQVGLTPDNSGLWVLGVNELALVDLNAYSAILPSAFDRQPAFPLVPAGGLLVVLGLAPLAVRGSRAFRPERGEQQAVPKPRLQPGGVGSAQPVADTAAAQRILPHARTARVVALGGIVLVALGGAGAWLTQASLVGPTGKNDPWPRLALLAISGLAWAVGCRASARGLPLEWIAEWSSPPIVTAGVMRLTMHTALVVGVGVVLAVGAAATWWASGFSSPDATWGMLLWLLAVACIGNASVGSSFRWRPRASGMILTLLALFAIALLPRLWQAADLPYGIWYDEAQNALEMRRVVHQGVYTPILNTYGKDTSGFFYVVSALWVVLGDTILAARAGAALVGALNVAMVYLLARELFGWRVGLAASLLLAFMRWHLNFSRLGFNPISLPLCATIAFWLLSRAVRRKQWSDVAWAGFALGVGLHAYAGFRGMLAVALVAVFAAASLHRWPIRWFAPRVGLYLGTALLTALPVVLFALLDPMTFNGRTTQTLILTQPAGDAEKMRQIWETLQRHALMFNVSGDLNGRHNLPGAPMLDPLTGALVSLGLGWLLIRPRDWRTVLLLAWSAVAMSGGILTLAFEAPQGLRTLGITPVLAVLGGIGLVASLDRLLAVATLAPRVCARRATVATLGLGVLVLSWIGWSNLDTYFARQMRDADVFAAFSTRETVVAKAALDDGGRSSAILASTTMTPSVEEAFLVPDLTSMIRQFDPGGDLPFRGPGPGKIFLETEHDQPLADEVARLYPDAPRRSIGSPGGGKPIVEGFSLEPELLAAHRGVQATYRAADGVFQRVEARPGEVATAIPLALPVDVSWQGGLALDASGEYSFRVPTGFELRIDGALLTSAAGTGVRVQLVRGNHTLEESGTMTDSLATGLEWRTPRSSRWLAVPSDMLFLVPPGGLGLQLRLRTELGRDGPAGDEYIDPVLAHYYHVSPFARLHLDPPVWTAEWSGALDAPTSGTYGFSLDHSQAAAVFIDDHQVLGNLNLPSDVRTTSLELSSGRHTIRVRLEKTNADAPFIYLYWSPPGALPRVVPGDVFYAQPPVVLGPADARDVQ